MLTHTHTRTHTHTNTHTQTHTHIHTHIKGCNIFFSEINEDAFNDYMEYLDQRFQPNFNIQFDFQR